MIAIIVGFGADDDRSPKHISSSERMARIGY